MGGMALSQLTADVMAQKTTASKTLTPVAGEARPPALPKTDAPFPNDMPSEVIEQKVGELDRIIGHLVEARDAMAALVNMPLPGEVVDEKAEQKAAERAADEKFAEHMKQLQSEAQAAVFAPTEEVGPTDDGWTCPEHGKAVEKTSKKTGATFIGCPDCNLFAR